jgi:hypothetical protein
LKQVAFEFTSRFPGTLQNGIVWSSEAARGTFALQFDGIDDQCV